MFVPKISCSRICNKLIKIPACGLETTTVLDLETMPTPRSLPIVGTTLSLLCAGSTSKLHEYVDKRHKQLGPIYKEKIGPIEAIFVSDPDEMRAIFAQEGKYPVHILPEPWMVYNEVHGCSRGLFFMDGPEWLKYRKIMNKLLLKGDLEWIDISCEWVIDNFVEELHKTVAKNQEVRHLNSLLYKLSLDILVSLLIGAESYQQHRQQFEESVLHLANTVHLVFETTCKLSLISANSARKWRIPRWKSFEKAVDEALTSTNLLVKRLIETVPNSGGLLGRMREENIPQDYIIRIVADLILAAGDTTAYSMQWILYLVSKHKHVQLKLRKHIKSDEPSSPYLRNIVKESLRLYPVAPFLTRFLPEEAIIGGYKVPSNTLTVMSIYSSGRDDSYFKVPEAFMPERWDRKNLGMSTQQATLPFAIGARSCIGRKLADYQLQHTLAKLIENFDVELLNTNIESVLKMVMVPSEAIRLRLTKI